MIVTLPTFTGVTLPVASTVAIAESLEVYVTAAFAGAVFAVNCTGVPTTAIVVPETVAPVASSRRTL